MGDLTTHPECHALLRAILTDPADDLARLLYADHLEESGETARAEFIRVQIEAERLETAVAGWASRPGSVGGAEAGAALADAQALRRHERELLAGRDYEWFFPRGVLSEPAQWRFRRGFVNSIATTAADFLAHAAALFAAQPITEVRLTDREPWSNATFADWSYPCGWQESMTWWLREPYRLPPPLWETMKAPFVRDDIGYPDRVKCFPDLATAHAALSRACVAYGREQAGLPPLSEETKR